MDITTAPLSLVEAAKRALTPDLVSQASSMTGEPSASVYGALSGLLPSILGQAAGRSGDAGFTQKLFGMLGDPALDTAGTSTSALLSGVVEGSSPLAKLGSGFMAALFGGRPPEIAQGAARASGIKASSAVSLLALAGPMALGLLRNAVRDENVTASGFGRWLGAQAPALQAATPAWFSGVMGGSPRLEPRAAERVERVDRVDRVADVTRPSRGAPPAKPGLPRWLMYLVGGLAVVGILWSLGRRGAEQPTPPRAEAPTVTAPPMVAPPTVAPGRMITRELPTGAALEFPENSLEASMLAAIQSGSTGAWYDFDRLRFGTDETTLDPSSQAQLQNIARILEAYPNARVEIGGFTDNQGVPADNLTLSQGRADNVVQALGGMGVASGRMTARGYGEAQPVASNATEAGRAQNRRVSLRITEL